MSFTSAEFTLKAADDESDDEEEGTLIASPAVLGSELGINFKDETTQGKTIGDILQDLSNAASKAVDDWNDTYAEDAGYHYKYAGLSTDGETADILSKAVKAGGTDVTILVTRIDDEDESGDKRGGYINGGIQNPHDNVTGASAQVANTVVDFGDYWKDGTQIKIGDTTYTVALDPDSKFKNVTNVVYLTEAQRTGTYTTEDGKEVSILNQIAAQRLAAAAKDNGIFTVGHDGQLQPVEGFHQRLPHRRAGHRRHQHRRSGQRRAGDRQDPGRDQLRLRRARYSGRDPEPFGSHHQQPVGHDGEHPGC